MRWCFLFAVSFLLKVLSGGSFISRIRRKYGQRVVSLIHKVDRLSHKRVKLCNDIVFLNKCMQFRIAPKFVRFKTANSHLGRSAAYCKSQRLLLREELRTKHRERAKVSIQVNNAKFDVISVLSTLDKCSFRLWLSTSARNFNTTVKARHTAKLA